MNPTAKKILNMIRARYPLLYVVSPEENRVEEHLASLDKALDTTRTIVAWSATEGFHDMNFDGKEATDPHQAEIMDPVEALNHIMEEEHTNPVLYVMRDFHHYFVDPIVCRRVRDLHRTLRDEHKNVVFLSPIQMIPPDLTHDIVLVEFDLPSREEMEELILDVVEGVDEVDIDLSEDRLRRIVDACMGLDSMAAECVLSRSVVEKRDLDEKLIQSEKKATVKRDGILEFIDTDVSMDDVGGLDLLKSIFRKAAKTLSEKAKKFGLRTPKGWLLLGKPGCGKSLTAKAAGSYFRLPVLRLDVGKVFGSLIGESEEKMRRAIDTAEAIAPVILWLDELEKGFAGTKSSGETDSGVTARVFGSFITWLQEKKSLVIVIATSNDISQLPPELTRAGRFDKIIALDLPTSVEREQILDVHLRKRDRTIDDFDVSTLVKASKGLSGAEIEQALEESLQDAFDKWDGDQDIDTELFAYWLKAQIPVTTVMDAQELSKSAEWLKAKAVPASSPEEGKHVGGRKGRRLEM